MARKHSKAGKKRTHKQRKHRGGGWGFTGPSSIPGAPGTVSNPQVFTGIGDCRAVKPGYDIPYSQYGASFKGLPGMSGGRRTRKGSKSKTRKQRGGRYGFFPEGAAGVTPNGAAWWAGTYPPVQRIGCEGGSVNPLNPTHTGSSAPPGAANPNYYLKGGAQLAPATYGVGNVDSMYYYAPTAGYANTASTWKDSVGAPVQIQVPFAARAMNQACLTTGGSPPLTGALQTGGKRSRKARRGGALNIPFLGITVPSSLDNLRRIYNNTRSRMFGASEAAATPPLEGPAEAPAAVVTSGNGNNRNNRNNGNANRRNNGNANRRNNAVVNNGMGMNGEAPPEMEAEVEMQAPVNGNSLMLPNRNNSVSMPAENPTAPPVTPPPQMNAFGTPNTPAAVTNTSTPMATDPSMPTPATFGGRGRRKSRRSKRSAQQKKKV